MGDNYRPAYLDHEDSISSYFQVRLKDGEKQAGEKIQGEIDQLMKNSSHRYLGTQITFVNSTMTVVIDVAGRRKLEKMDKENICKSLRKYGEISKIGSF